MINRAAVINENFRRFCTETGPHLGIVRRVARDGAVRDDLDLTGADLVTLFESQVISRQLDLIARELRKENRSFYTIGSSGHEGNVVLGRCLRATDPAFLHYRSGALMVERARQAPEVDLVRDTLLGLMAAAEDPIAGGRHKVWGSRRLWVPPQTSTIASHLPKAVGAALAMARARRLGAAGPLPSDAIILCTFGDASANHATATAAFNTASYSAYNNLPLPLLFVCENNDLGISVRTPPGWIETNFSRRPELRYFEADGLDLVDAYATARAAAAYVRSRRKPAFLHLKVVRLMGHAGSDVETEYRTLDELAEVESRDPLLSTARLLMERGLLSAAEVLNLYDETARRIHALALGLSDRPQLQSAAEIVRPLAPVTPAAVEAAAGRAALDANKRARAHGVEKKLPEDREPRHMAVLINHALADLLVQYPEMVVFGEDVAAKGGVYHVTTGLSLAFGVGRVFNTLLDETSILGMAIGAAHLGLLPVPEIQYLAYVYNAIDQLRGEACSTQFFSNGQFRNGMVVRIASLGYQKGFGGHFHNDNGFGSLRELPGVVIACPSRGDDAAAMLRTCLALAKVDGRVVLFMEPIALYMTKDLHAPGDRRWLTNYPAPGVAIPLGEGRVYEPGADPATNGFEAGGDQPAAQITILTYGNGVYLSLRAAHQLLEQNGLAVRVVDLRWLHPLNEDWIVEQARVTGRVLIVDEGRRSGGMAEPLMALLLERCGGAVRAERVTGVDSYVPLGPAAELVLPSQAQIVSRALALHAGATDAPTIGRASAAPVV